MICQSISTAVFFCSELLAHLNQEFIMNNLFTIVLIHSTLVFSSISDDDICTAEKDCLKNEQNSNGSTNLYSKGKKHHCSMLYAYTY